MEVLCARMRSLWNAKVDIDDLVWIADDAYTKEQVLEMETAMLTVLRFNLRVPTIAHFLDSFAQCDVCSEGHRHLIQYLAELTLLEARMLQYPPSHVAAAALLLSNMLLGKSPIWMPHMTKHMKCVEHLVHQLLLLQTSTAATASATSYCPCHCY